MISPFHEALKALAVRGVMPTGLDSAALRQLSASVRRQSFFSARTTLAGLLDAYKEKAQTILNPVDQDGRQVGLDVATARMEIRELQRSLGYAPGEEEAGTVRDLSSDARIDLVLKTNQQLAQGAGDFLRMNNPELVDMWPAQELYRLEAKDKERDWAARWRIAAAVVNDPMAAAALDLRGRMAALKSSGIWQALGDGEGGYQDTLGNPYPPFAFNSGMWVRELSRREAQALGLITAEQEAAVNGLDLSQLFSVADAA